MFVPLHDKNSLINIRLQYVTLLLIAANVLIWLFTIVPAAESVAAINAFYYSYGFIPAVVSDLSELPPEFVVIPESTSYVTYAFLHGDFMHLAGNMLFLWVFGDNVEDAMGHVKFLVFYLVSAALAALAHQFASPESAVPLVGASGATAGVIGAYLVLHPKVKIWVLVLGRIPLRLSAMWVLGGWFAFQIFSFVTNIDNQISWAAHIGGFFAGAILVFLFKNRGVPLFDAGIEPITKPKAQPKSPHQWGRDPD